MKGKKRRGKIEEASFEIDLTPAINVALLLVLIFITGASQIFQTWLTVTAPKVKKGPKQQQQVPQTEFKVNIYLKEDGTILLNEEPISKEILDTLLPQLLARSPTRLVLVSADSLVKHGDVVEILDLAKQKGANEVALLRRY